MATDFLEALRALPNSPNTGRRHALKATVPAAAIALAAQYVDQSKAEQCITEWLNQDYPNRLKNIGRPANFTLRSYLVAVLACAIARVPVSLTQIHYLLVSDLPKATRQAMGLPSSPAKDTDTRLDTARRQSSYYSVVRLSTKVASVIDPRPFPSHRGLTRDEQADIEAARDLRTMERNQRRADQLTSQMLTAIWAMLPGETTRAWRGDITLDATVVPVFGQKGHRSNRRVTPGADSPEANAGWHAKTQDRRDTADTNGKPGATEYTFGYDAHLAMTAGDGVGSIFPALVLGMSLDRPGCAPGLNAAAMLEGIPAAGLPTGLLTVDMGYSQLDAANFHLPVRALGYGLVMMYKSNETGIQATHQGAVMVEGTWYGPCIPKPLINATQDYFADRIDEDTYRSRITQRAQYALRLKSKTADGARYQWRCPAAGKGATMRCQHKPEMPLPPGAKPLPLALGAPKNAIGVCANTTTITIPVTVGARDFQEIPYQSKRWRSVYASARNQMEGKNRYLKNAVDAAIALPDHRRYRGLGKQVITLLVKLVAANITTVLTFLDKAERDQGEPPTRATRGRPRNPGLEPYLTDPHGPPHRLTGWRKPKQDEKKKAA